MSGSYCRYCNHRCFVYRVLPGQDVWGHMATCPKGMEHDRETLGCDHTTAINPLAARQLVNALRVATEASTGQLRFELGVAAMLRTLADLNVAPAMLTVYAEYLTVFAAERAGTEATIFACGPATRGRRP